MKTNCKLLFEALVILNKEEISLETSLEKASQTTTLLVLDSYAIIRSYLNSERLLKHNPRLRQPCHKEHIGGGLYQTYDKINSEFITDHITEKCQELINSNTLENYLKRKKIFLYVGHSNWGKSFTLKHITNGNSKKKIIKLYDKTFRVRKMSNDDNEVKLLEFVNGIRFTNYQNYIIAFCPKQLTNQRSLDILNILISFSDLYFFVQKKQYHRENMIDDTEIQSLKDYGTVFILEEDLEYNERAEKLLDFIGIQL